MERAQVVLRHVSCAATNGPSSFKYTLDGASHGVLSTEQRAFYEENGYLVIPKLVSAELLEAYRQRFVEICDGTVPARA